MVEIDYSPLEGYQTAPCTDKNPESPNNLYEYNYSLGRFTERGISIIYTAYVLREHGFSYEEISNYIHQRFDEKINPRRFADWMRGKTTIHPLEALKEIGCDIELPVETPKESSDKPQKDILNREMIKRRMYDHVAKEIYEIFDISIEEARKCAPHIVPMRKKSSAEDDDPKQLRIFNLL